MRPQKISKIRDGLVLSKYLQKLPGLSVQVGLASLWGAIDRLFEKFYTQKEFFGENVGIVALLLYQYDFRRLNEINLFI